MPIDLEPDEPPSKSNITSVRIPEEWEPYIAAGMERLNVKRHAYLLKALKHVVLKEKPITKEAE